MKKITFFLLSAILGFLTVFSQSTLELTFTAIDSATHVQLDSIKIMNRTQGGDTVLYWPDTVLVLYHVGIRENIKACLNFQLHQNHPNPVMERTNIKLCVPERDNVIILITDVLGRQILKSERVLDKGCHEFSFIPGNAKIYFLTAFWMSKSQSIKMLNTAVGYNHRCYLEYQGNRGNDEQMKNTPAIQNFSYTLGDKLLYIGYSETLQSGMPDTPQSSETYTFQFATNIPCPGTPTVDYEGQTYNTIQIFSQCWFKENLNVGVMIVSSQSQTNNDTIEKYCMSDNEYYCNNFAGGLYLWDEMMKYTNEAGGKGICPDGWHIPDDLDWQILEGAVDSDYKIGNQEWENYNWRGADAGGNLKQTGTTSWEPPNNGATDAFGFSALPGGYFVQGGFWGPGHKGYFWSSDYTKKYYRNLDWNQIKVNRKSGGNGFAISVRCIKNK